MKIPKKVQEKIDYLCQKINKVEWSGVLFYTVEGSITNFSKMKLVVQDVYPMDKGTTGATGYELGENFISYRMDNPETLAWKIGMIHSHHNMKSYFSGTDMDELDDNTEFHNYYLSLVVNNRGEKVAKVAFRGTIKAYECKDEAGQPWDLTLKKERQVMFHFDCKISEPKTFVKVPKDFADRTLEIINASNLKQKVFKKNVKQFESQKLLNPFSKVNPYVSPGNFNGFRSNDAMMDKEMEDLDADMWNNSFSMTPDVQIKEKRMESFLQNVINLGNLPINDREDLEDTLENTLGMVHSEEYINKVLIMYPALFEKFWDVFGEINTEVFIDTTIGVMAILEDFEGVYPICAPLKMSLEAMLTKLAVHE